MNRKATTRAALIVSAAAIGARALGFGEKLVLAHYFGISPLVDIYFASLALFWAVHLFAKEVIEPSFLPSYLEHRTSGTGRAAAGTLQITLLAVTGVFGLVAWLGAWGAPAISRWLLPGLDLEAHRDGAAIIRAAAPALLFLPLSSVTYVMLNAEGRFARPAFGDLLLKLWSVGLIAWVGSGHGEVWWLGVGIALGAFSRLFVHVTALLKPLSAQLSNWFVPEGDRNTLRRLAAPLVLGALFGQVAELADNWFAAALGPGAVSVRNYARRLVELPLMIAPYALSVALLPALSKLFTEADEAGFAAALRLRIRQLCLMFLPITVMYLFFAEPLTSLVLERGAFGTDAREATAHVLEVYALSLPVLAIQTLFSTAYFARQGATMVVATSVAGVVVHVVAAAILAPVWGVVGIAVALLVGKVCKLGALVWFARHWLFTPAPLTSDRNSEPSLRGPATPPAASVRSVRKAAGVLTGRYVLGVICSILAAWAVSDWVQGQIGAGEWRLAAALIAGGGAATGAFLVVAARRRDWQGS